MVKSTTITLKQLAQHKTMRMDAGYWIKKMDNRTKLIFRIKSLIMKCRERGKWDLALRLKDKLDRVLI
tara:strand:+ start:137 stop:340 length:204 start_codon:yes stop_codon:yes gene_type:complete